MFVYFKSYCGDAQIIKINIVLKTLFYELHYVTIIFTVLVSPILEKVEPEICTMFEISE